MLNADRTSQQLCGLGMRGGSHIPDIMRIHCVMSSHVVCCVVLVSESAAFFAADSDLV